jgi:hypothetical protein
MGEPVHGSGGQQTVHGKLTAPAGLEQRQTALPVRLRGCWSAREEQQQRLDERKALDGRRERRHWVQTLNIVPSLICPVLSRPA